MHIKSSAFEHNESLPKNYSCDGEGVNPPLQFSDIPASAKSLVLLMDDPDVPKYLKPDGMWDHWVVYNMEPTVTEIAENSTPPGMMGLNSGGQPGFYAACPPDRQHRYFFKLYALDTKLTFDSDQVTKHMVEQAMEGHVIEKAELIGLYERVKQ